MKKPFFSLSLAIMAALLITGLACNKNASTTATTNSNSNHIPPDQKVTASLQGRVVDENGIPVQGAAVTSGGTTTSTDINGVFSFSSISMSSRFGFVKVVKSGYFTGSRSIITNAAASNYVTIQLIPETAAAGTFPAATGGKVVVGTGDTASFAPSSVVEASSGTPYTGMVTVYATYLNPTDPNLYKYMPGDLRGIGSDGNETALESFGMMDVEMVDASGNKLQLASGQPAILTFAIPDTLLSIAPATIPLWYFNDTTGKWMEQGTAVKQGNNYIGQVGHFTFWNCDAPMGTVNFTVTLKDQLGNPLAYTYVQFHSQSWGTRGGYTNAAGMAQGLIPKGQELVLQAVTECGTVVGGVNVGPALTDQNLGTIVITLTNSRLILTGSVVDCSNNPVDSGYVSITVDGLDYAAAVNNGSFVLPINRCYSTTTQVRLTAAEYSPAQSGPVVSVEAGSDTMNVGQLSACGNPFTQYMDVTLGSTPYNITNPPGSINYSIQKGNSEFYALSGSSTVGLLDMNQLSGTGTFAGVYNLVSGNRNVLTDQSVQVNVSQFGPVNGYITGTITGNVYDSIQMKTVPITGSLYVIRTQ